MLKLHLTKAGSLKAVVANKCSKLLMLVFIKAKPNNGWNYNIYIIVLRNFIH